MKPSEFTGMLLCTILAFAECKAQTPNASGSLAPDDAVAPTAFVVCDPASDAPLPSIVLQYDPEAKSGANWAEVEKPRKITDKPPMIIGRATTFLREGIERMTGKQLNVISTNDLSRGIVLTLVQHATPDIRDDPAIQRALAADPDDGYAAHEAFVIRSETNRLLLVANTANGLLAAVADLLESVDYEVLGMGPNWIHVPDYRGRPLVFAVNRADRPGFYVRKQWVTCGQGYGVGTITKGLTDPADEPVGVSYNRWRIGTRMAGRSMPPFPGHALQSYHTEVLREMQRQRADEGFLAPAILVGAASERPPADAGNVGWLWIDADTNAAPAEIAFTSDGKEWKPGARCALDISSPLVRRIILNGLIGRMTTYMQQGFDEPPDDLLIFPMDPEDGGGYTKLDALTRHPRWYPDYLAAEGVAFGQPYILNGYKGLDQPREIWDNAAASDHVYGLANYLLREFDKWAESLPAAERVTADGRSLSERVRMSFFCYNYHDVPPNFNLDPRIRVMIAGFSKHRGRGKWKAFASQEDLARAFQRMLPREPSGEYRIASMAYYRDQSAEGIPAKSDAAAEVIAADYRRLYAAGYRGVLVEMDFNFGKYGLAYYLTAQMLWNPALTDAELDALRDRWFQRAYGSVWQEMKTYYNFMLIRNFTINGPNFWAKAIRLIDVAARQLDPALEPAAARRLDDLKLFWYYHYLLASGRSKNRETPDEMLTFLWKAQMAYIVAMHGPVKGIFGGDGTGVGKSVGETLAAGPAHYTSAETAVWWADVLDYWPYVEVTRFAAGQLADGSMARDVDLNDLVAVAEFQDGKPELPFTTNCGTRSPRGLSFLVRAERPGDTVGFKLQWPFKPDRGFAYHAMTVPYGADIWNPESREWEDWIDPTMSEQQSVEATDEKGRRVQVAEIRLTAPRAGVYRFGFTRGGDGSAISSLGYEPVPGQDAPLAAGFTFDCAAGGAARSPFYFYIPKGTRTLDFEIWDRNGGMTLTLFKGLPATHPKVARKLDVSKPGAHRIALEAGEDGTVAALSNHGFQFPYLYSIPLFWAKSPGVLLVPRAIAAADGLTVVE